MNRRRFLKYAGATAAVAGASAIGLGYLSTRSAVSSQETLTTALDNWATTSEFNYPPVAKFDYKPKYLNPTDLQTIQFTNLSTDPEGDPLTYNWLVDNQSMSTDKDYSAKLPVGQHTIELEASDPFVKSTATQTVTVEPDQMYPTRQLRIKYKGMRMMVGWKGMSPIPSDVTDEKLNIIRDELGCNAVLIFGNTEFEDDLIEAGRMAVEKGFDRIYIAPLYLDLPVDETVRNIGEFAKKVKALRKVSEAVVFMIGHEFTFDAYGMIPGDTQAERLRFPLDHPESIRDNYWKTERSVLPDVFKRIIALCRENYGYQIAYAATPDEAAEIVPWSDPIFESVSSDEYIWQKVGWTEDLVLRHFSELKRFRKPVNSTEWGCLTYKGASQEWGFTDEDLAKYPYDEDEQADYIAQYCNMLNRARINGAFCNMLDDERLKGYGLYKATTPPHFGASSSRKNGFYMYKSYRRSA